MNVRREDARRTERRIIGGAVAAAAIATVGVMEYNKIQRDNIPAQISAETPKAVIDVYSSSSPNMASTVDEIVERRGKEWGLKPAQKSILKADSLIRLDLYFEVPAKRDDVIWNTWGKERTEDILGLDGKKSKDTALKRITAVEDQMRKQAEEKANQMNLERQRRLQSDEKARTNAYRQRQSR
jgi:hypothetical protein